MKNIPLSIVLPIAISLFSLGVSYVNYMGTNRLAQQTLDNSYRPVVLWEGDTDWDNVGSTTGTIGSVNPIALEVISSTAENISGYIVVDFKRYPLHFAGIPNGLSDPISISALKNYPAQWGWATTGAFIYARYLPSEGVSEISSNDLHVDYSDIEGNLYHLDVDLNGKQVSKRSR